MNPSATAAKLALVIAISCIFGCEAPPDPDAPPDQPDQRVAVVPVAVVRALPPGTILRLRPTEVAGGGAAIDRGFVDALLREALRLSTRFDVAADLEDCESPFELLPTIDAAAGQLAVALREGAGATLPLCAVGLDPKSIPEAIDRASFAIRQALGEGLAERVPSIADLYSASPECVRATERVMALEARGNSTAARELLDRARQADAGCTVTANATASWQLATGDAPGAERTARQALQLFAKRLSPTTQHRLARILLLARARTSEPGPIDQKLAELGALFLGDRPWDPHGRYTRGLAANYLGEFARAAEDLTVLRTRWPRVPWVGYQLAFAMLGQGDANGALDAIESAARQLPPEVTFMPRALALFGAGEHAELDEMIDRAASRDQDGTALQHEALRMKAAHAILTGRAALAGTAMLDDLEWLRQRPSMLADRSMDLAEAGQVLVHLGAGNALEARLDALREVQVVPSTVRLAMVFVEGMNAAAMRNREVAQVALGNLQRAQHEAWAAQLRAAIAEVDGDLPGQARELATAVRLDDTPLVRATFARALRALGRHEEADRLLSETRARMLELRLRAPIEHPLLAPGRALAFLATEPSGR